MRSKRNILSTVIMVLGICLLLAAAALFVYYRWDAARAAAAVEDAAIQLDRALEQQAQQTDDDNDADRADDPDEATEETVPDYILDPTMEMPELTVNGVDYIGRLTIDELELELPVISRWSYPNLKISPCRYQGSAYTGDLVIAAHNYKSHFGLIGQLTQGSTVTFTDLAGNVFNYQVTQVEQLKSTAIEEMTTGDWDLTLFTCTPGGAARVAVRCALVDE